MLVHWGELSEELPRLSRGTARTGVEPREKKACGGWGASSISGDVFKRLRQDSLQWCVVAGIRQHA